MQAAGLPNPRGARVALIALLAQVVNGAKAHYAADTEAQAREAFQIARAITEKARAPFRVLPNALEIRARESGGRISFGWQAPDEIGAVIDG